MNATQPSILVILPKAILAKNLIGESIYDE